MYDLMISSALTAYADNSDRSQQADAGIIGPSDIGFCRQKAALMTRGVEQSDSKSKWAAAVGTAIHNYVEAALKTQFPDWVLGSVDGLSVTTTLPSGAVISGHPDIVIPAMNTVLDIKTVDGLKTVKRDGPSQSHRYQRHLYALGCIESGLFDPAKQVYVGNVYLDRSAKETEPYVVMEEFDPTLTPEIDAWVTDVIYAVKNGEDAYRDIAPAVCERICSFYSVCRGGLPMGEGELIDAPELLSAVDMYDEGRRMEKLGKELKEEAAELLVGVNGTTTTKWNVRWTQVNPTRVEAFDKQGYSRLDIRRAR